MGRSRSRDTLVPPDFYEIHPKRSVNVIEAGWCQRGTVPFAMPAIIGGQLQYLDRGPFLMRLVSNQTAFFQH